MVCVRPSLSNWNLVFSTVSRRSCGENVRSRREENEMRWREWTTLPMFGWFCDKNPKWHLNTIKGHLNTSKKEWMPLSESNFENSKCRWYRRYSCWCWYTWLFFSHSFLRWGLTNKLTHWLLLTVCLGIVGWWKNFVSVSMETFVR